MKILTLLFSIYLSIHTFAEAPKPLTAHRAEQLKGLLVPAVEKCLRAPIYRNLNVGLRIESIDGKHILCNRNSKQLYIPASAIKVFMSAVSLIKFGPDYRFKTPLKTDGQVHNRELEGNLYLKGKGDPALMSSHLKEATEALKAQGIDIIKGAVVYDKSFLDSEEPRYAPNARHYYAPPGAITVNYNWLDTKLEDGPPPLLKTIPHTAYAQLDYKIT
ncbi:MAG: hypothetical protein GY757_27800, partial [bacterium]|nr:hypothetical protein [bacterium]